MSRFVPSPIFLTFRILIALCHWNEHSVFAVVVVKVLHMHTVASLDTHWIGKEGNHSDGSIFHDIQLTAEKYISFCWFRLTLSWYFICASEYNIWRAKQHIVIRINNLQTNIWNKYGFFTIRFVSLPHCPARKLCDVLLSSVNIEIYYVFPVPWHSTFQIESHEMYIETDINTEW